VIISILMKLEAMRFDGKSTLGITVSKLPSPFTGRDNCDTAVCSKTVVLPFSSIDILTDELSAVGVTIEDDESPAVCSRISGTRRSNPALSRSLI
jgi:hypothetical protein